MRKLSLLFIIFVVSGCFATHTAITKKELEVKTRVSDSIFLDPVADDKKVVYVRIRNTSGNPGLDISDRVKARLAENGYMVTENPAEAYFILQANVLQAGKNDNSDSINTSFGDAVIPGVLGGVVGKKSGGDTGAIIGAMAGATAGFIGSTFVQDTSYSVITDVQLSQKTGASPVSGRVIGDGVDLYEGIEGWKNYTTRVISYANQVNLKYEAAEPAIVEALVNSVAGVI